nr:MAG TPA: hypothetical protein [Caudoviricetes sp.]
MGMFLRRGPAPRVGIPAKTLAIGRTVKLNVGGSAKDFLVVHQGHPSGSYDASCDGTWMLMKDIYNKRRVDTSNTYLNNTFLGSLDDDVKNAIKSVRIPYLPDGKERVEELACKVFLLSGYEVGWTTKDAGDYLPVDGSKLSYFESGTGASANNKRIAKYDGAATAWWLRSNRIYNSGWGYAVTTDGMYTSQTQGHSYGIRPAFILPSDFLLTDGMLV